jgi:hypothetical protein
MVSVAVEARTVAGKERRAHLAPQEIAHRGGEIDGITTPT